MSESYCSNKPAFFLVLAFALALSPVAAHAAVEVRDAVTVSGNTIMLSARTGGRFFSEGGQLVEFLVSGESLGKTLSGGDAIAYMEFKAKDKGLHELLARSGDDEDKGLLLVAEPGTRVLLVDVAGALFKDPIGRDPRDDALDVLKALGTRYQMICLHSRLFGLKHVRQWLKDNGFPPMPVTAYQKGRSVRRLRRMGLSVEAIVTGPTVMGEILEGDVKVFTFDKKGTGEHVSTWEEVREALSETSKDKQ